MKHAGLSKHNNHITKLVSIHGHHCLMLCLGKRGMGQQFCVRDLLTETNRTRSTYLQTIKFLNINNIRFSTNLEIREVLATFSKTLF